MMKRIAATEKTRERLRALIDGRLGTGADRSDLVRLAVQLIIEEVLEAEARDKLGRERYERSEGEPSGYRNGYRTGRLKTAEGSVRFSHRNCAIRPSLSYRRFERISLAAPRRWRTWR